MRLTDIHRPGGIAVLVLWGMMAGFVRGEEALPAADELLEKLRALDSLYQSGVTFRGERKLRPPIPDSVHPAVTYQFVFTAQHPRHAYLSEVDELPLPGSLPGGDVLDLAVYEDPQSKKSRTNIEKRKVAYFDDQISGNLVTYGVFEFSEDGSLNMCPM